MTTVRNRARPLLLAVPALIAGALAAAPPAAAVTSSTYYVFETPYNKTVIPIVCNGYRVGAVLQYKVTYPWLDVKIGNEPTHSLKFNRGGTASVSVCGNHIVTFTFLSGIDTGQPGPLM